VEGLLKFLNREKVEDFQRRETTTLEYQVP